VSFEAPFAFLTATSAFPGLGNLSDPFASDLFGAFLDSDKKLGMA
jgi:hypothetical protein